ncbi:MAG: 30S ribosomal protein S20 [Bdellovibrionales bacterium]|nr:30S ribosomal protein S20 [Bdellovibrionales bacterium]
MANHKSAEKRARQSLKLRARRLSVKRKVRSEEKKLSTAIEQKDIDTAQNLLTSFMSKLGKAAQKGIYSKETAARKISRLSKKLHTASK